MSNVTFTLASETDLPRIVDTYNQSIPGRLATADTEPVSIESKKEWFAAHQIKNRPLWIIHSENEYAGWLSLSNFYGRPAYSGTAEISIYLNNSQHGKSIGKKALEFAMQQSAQLEIHTLLAFIFGHNKSSLHLFKSYGFTQYAFFPEVAVLDKVKRDLIILGKKI